MATNIVQYAGSASPQEAEPVGLADLLVRLSHAVQCAFAEASRDCGLSAQQAQLLCHLTERPLGMTELSQRLRLEKSSLTGLVDRVERRGLVVRHRDDRDRRACRIALTDHGASLAHEAHRAVTTRLDTMTATLPIAARQRLWSAITLLLSAKG